MSNSASEFPSVMFQAVHHPNYNMQTYGEPTTAAWLSGKLLSLGLLQKSQGHGSSHQ